MAAFLVNLLLNLRHLRTPDRRTVKSPSRRPLSPSLFPPGTKRTISATCLESLQKQDYPNYEILVLDDDSGDRTWEIVSSMAAADDRIHLFRGKPLPTDWAGKPFACYQLARKASGSWLLFVDADTIHAPHMLRSVLALALEEKTSLLSGFDHQITETLLLKIIMPVMYFIMLGWAPLWLLHKSRKPKPSIAIGQFLLFARDEYWRMGGHQAVKNRVVEDIWLGVEMARIGGRHIAIDLSPVVSCNMYRTVASAWNGLGKSIYAIVAMSPLAIIGLVAIAAMFYIMPFFWLWHGYFAGYESLFWRILVGLQIVMMLFMRWLVDNRFREPGISMWFHPLGLGFYLVNVVHSALRWLTGAGVTWKDRTYEKESPVDVEKT